MKIQSKVVAALERPYSLALLPWYRDAAMPAFVAGSEGEGRLICCEPPDFGPRVLAEKPGGFISVCPCVLGSRRYVVAVANFSFNAGECRIQVIPLERNEAPVPAQVGRVPYAHRIAVVDIAGKNYFLASTLFGETSTPEKKEPGGLYVAAIPDAVSSPWQLQPIAEELNYNHGFEPAKLRQDGDRGYLVSCSEGLFFQRLPKTSAELPWPPRDVIAEGPHSDACACDWRGAGLADVFAISPFHGNVLCVYSRAGDTWRKTVIRDDLDLGHVVWAGNLLGRPGLVAASRRGRCELRLFRSDDGATFTERVIEEGVGAAQIAVLDQDAPAARLLVSARDQNAIVMYELGI